VLKASSWKGSIMPVVPRSAAPEFAVPQAGVTVVGLAAPSRGSSENCAWEVRFPPGEAGPAHSLDHEELFVVLTGHLTVTLGTVVHQVGPGDAVIAPAHQVFSIANPHDEPASAIGIMPIGFQARIGDSEPFTPPWGV